VKRANVVNEEACQSLLLKMRDEGLVNLDIQKGNGSSDDTRNCGDRPALIRDRCAFLRTKLDLRPD
jgi:hypothetical protein